MRTTKSKSTLSHLNYFELVSFIQKKTINQCLFQKAFLQILLDKTDCDPLDDIGYVNMNYGKILPNKRPNEYRKCI